MLNVTSLQLFEQGVVDAISRKLHSNPDFTKKFDEQPNNTGFELMTLMMNKYPNFLEFPLKNSVLYFRDNKVYEDFKANGVIVETLDGVDYFKPQVEALRVVMGYPPTALAGKEYHEMKDANIPLTAINYYGLRFTSAKDTVKESIDWLKENKPVDTSVIQGDIYYRDGDGDGKFKVWGEKEVINN